MPTVAVHGVSYYLSPEAVLQHAITLGRAHGELIAIDVVSNNENFPPPRLERLALGGVVLRQLPKSDRWLDASAYTAAARDSVDADIHIFFNDTLITRHSFKRICNLSAKLGGLLSQAVISFGTGPIYPTQFVLQQDEFNPYRRHLANYYFALNRAGAREFARFANDFEALEEQTNTVIAAAGSGVGVSDLPPKYRAVARLLHIHLFVPDSPIGWRRPISQASEKVLYARAGSVLFEYLFSAEFIHAGGVLYPLNVSRLLRIEEFLRKRLRR